MTASPSALASLVSSLTATPGRGAGESVQDVRGDEAHGDTTPASRSIAISRSWSATIERSVSSSLLSRLCNEAKISSADRPAA